MAAALLLLAAAPAAGAAQLIPIRTVPVSQAHQFEIFPSHTLGMGGVSIAVRDSLLDPFSNPATGARLRAPLFSGAPALYSVTSQAGAGRALPLGALSRAGAWYGGLMLALQQVDLSERPGFVPGPLPFCPACQSGELALPSDDRTLGNQYVFAMLGRDVPAAGISLGGSVFWAGLNAVDGVDLLYAGSARIKQFGSAVDLRLGMLKEWADGDHSVEALVLHNRFGMTHDVFYLDNFWDPANQQVAQRPRLERNLDHTHTWGLHLNYERPLAADGWRIGGLGTANYKTHPKIPNYEIMNIPRDPGYSTALNVGVGIARARPASTFGIDLVYEPIWSYTWADSEDPVVTQAGETIPAGGRTIENWFRFSNALLRMGVGEEFEMHEPGTVLGLQLGLAVRSIHYWLEQQDNVQLSRRNQEEQWVEWTPTWGLMVRRSTLEIRYRGLVTHGTGRPGVAGPPGGFFALPNAEAAGSNILVAPSGPLTLDPVRVHAHQISVALPLR